MDTDTGYMNDDIEAIGHIPPPGQEAEAIDQEGGELLVFEGLEDVVARARGLGRTDSRIRTDRIEIQTSQWEKQMDNLVQVYLAHRSRDRGDRLPHTTPSENTEEDEDIHPVPSFIIETLDSYCSSRFSPRPLPVSNCLVLSALLPSFQSNSR